jgi:hypothetical protein
MSGRARGFSKRNYASTDALRAQQRNGIAGRPTPYPGDAWPANDNKPPVWRGALAWALVGMGIGCFAFVAVSLLM